MSETFAFEIIVRLSQGKGFHHEGDIPDLILHPNGIKVKLKLINKVNMEGFDSLILKAGGFASENDAKQYAAKIRDSIYINAILLKEAFKIIEFNIRKEGVLYLGGNEPFASSKPLDNYVQDFKKAVELSYKLNDKHSLAIELYNLSHFETAQYAKFVTLISAIECLSEQKKRSHTIIDHIWNLIKLTCKSKLDPSEKDSLLDNLKNLKNESHGASCRRLIEEKLKKESTKAKREFTKYYKIRGEILHDGRPKEEVNIDNELTGLDNLVSNLLGAVISEFN